MRYALLCVSLLVGIGCRGNQMNFTPFPTSGPTLMPPPGTGSAGRPDPYYRPSPTTPSPAMTGSHGSTPLPAQFARFTSEDAASAQLADSRASYNGAVSPSGADMSSGLSTNATPIPPTSDPTMAPADGGLPAGPVYGQPAPMSPAASGAASQLPPAQAVNAPVSGWSDRY